MKLMYSRMRGCFSIFALIMFFSMSCAFAEGEGKTKRVQDDVRTMIKAVNERNVDVALGYTWPEALKKLGGVERIKEGLKVAYTEFDKLYLKFTDVTFPKDPKFFKMGKRFFVIVYADTVLSMKRDQQPIKMLSSSFFFGIRNSEKEDWKYLDGVKINSRTVRSFFPEFPENYEFPKPVMKPAE